MFGLDQVTITGIDDNTDLSFIDEMTDQFSFVEWGILISDTRKGSPRYPSDRRLAELTTMFRGKYDQFSGHVCGSLSERLIAEAGETYVTGELIENTDPRFFTRLQLNSFGDSTWTHSAVNRLAWTLTDRAEIILPIINDTTVERVQHRFLDNVSFLHDRSQGRGIQPIDWPDVQLGGYVGFAGGINPDNILENLDILYLKFATKRFWIDMETGVRTDDRIDPKKIKKVLEIAAKYIE